MSSPWTHDWVVYAYEQLRERGFGSMTEFVRKDETTSFHALAEELGKELLAPVQIRKLFRCEVRSEADLDYFIRTNLVRDLLYQVPSGFRVGDPFLLTMALVSWQGSMDESLGTWTRGVVKRIQGLSDVPDTWVPQSVDDDVLKHVFSISRPTVPLVVDVPFVSL